MTRKKETKKQEQGGLVFSFSKFYDLRLHDWQVVKQKKH
jgi:hypothetical protein